MGASISKQNIKNVNDIITSVITKSLQNCSVNTNGTSTVNIGSLCQNIKIHGSVNNFSYISTTQTCKFDAVTMNRIATDLKNTLNSEVNKGVVLGLDYTKLRERIENSINISNVTDMVTETLLNSAVGATVNVGVLNSVSDCKVTSAKQSYTIYLTNGIVRQQIATFKPQNTLSVMTGDVQQNVINNLWGSLDKIDQDKLLAIDGAYDGYNMWKSSKFKNSIYYKDSVDKKVFKKRTGEERDKQIYMIILRDMPSQKLILPSNNYNDKAVFFKNRIIDIANSTDNTKYTTLAQVLDHGWSITIGTEPLSTTVPCTTTCNDAIRDAGPTTVEIDQNVNNITLATGMQQAESSLKAINDLTNSILSETSTSWTSGGGGWVIIAIVVVQGTVVDNGSVPIVILHP